MIPPVHRVTALNDACSLETAFGAGFKTSLPSTGCSRKMWATGQLVLFSLVRVAQAMGQQSPELA